MKGATTHAFGRAWIAVAALGDLLSAASPTAQAVIEASGVEAGLAVVVGTTDGALEAELTAGSGQSVFIGVEAMTYGRSRLVDGDPAAGGRLLVQGLALSDEAAARARKHLFERGLYGLASVSRVASARPLPYYPRIVNLLVADLDSLWNEAPPHEEIDRVLGYEGVAYLKQGGQWTKSVLKTPPEIDVWTHYHYDASGNPVSKDEVVAQRLPLD
jgi:hypothetical protein